MSSAPDSLGIIRIDDNEPYALMRRNNNSGDTFQNRMLCYIVLYIHDISISPHSQGVNER